MHIVKFYEGPSILNKITDYQMNRIIQDQLNPQYLRIADSEYYLYSTDDFQKFIKIYSNQDPFSLISRENKWTRPFNTGLGYVDSMNFFVDPDLKVWMVEPKKGILYEPKRDEIFDLVVI